MLSSGNNSDYSAHLKKAHSQEAAQYLQYMPTVQTVRLHSRPQHADAAEPVAREFVAGALWSHPNCGTVLNVYDTEESLDRPLKRSHKIAAKDLSKYYSGIEADNGL
jgi:hypothetical protein